MAWTERYVRSDAAGGGDGTTNTNSGANGAWTLAEGITNEAAGMRLNVMTNGGAGGIGTFLNTSTGRTFAAAGTTTAPIWWRGAKNTAGDQDVNNAAVAGTDIPSLTFTTGQMVCSGAHHIFSNLDISGACVTANGQVAVTATGNTFYGVRFANSAANANAAACIVTSTGTGVAFERCNFTAATTTVTRMVFVGAAGALVQGCTFTFGTIGLEFAASGAALFNVFDRQASDAIKVSVGSVWIANNSVYQPTGNGINMTAISAGIFITNNYFEAVPAAKYAINNTTGTNTNFIRCIANAYYCPSAAGNTNGLGDSPLIFDNGTLGSAGFVLPGSQNFALASVAKALGFPGKFENTAVYQGYLDPGAVQRLEGGIGFLVGGGLAQ